MIRAPSDYEHLTLNVYLTNGQEYLNVDTTEKPFGEDGNMVGFWTDETTIVMVPMKGVYMIEMLFGEDTNE